MVLLPEEYRVNEQAAREIYLKAYQAAFEKSGANGVMTAYTRWGAVWSGGVKGLMTNIMRLEWGNNGMSITDNVITPMVTGADGVLAGVTTYDAMLWYIVSELPKYENDPVVVAAMREACHQNLYAIANSIRKGKPDAKIVYIKGDQFTIELITAIQTGKNIEDTAILHDLKAIGVDLKAWEDGIQYNVNTGEVTFDGK